MLVILGGICLIIVLLKVTYRARTNLVSIARQAILPYLVRNQQAGNARTHHVPCAQFDEIVEEPTSVRENGNIREPGQSSK